MVLAGLFTFWLLRPRPNGLNSVADLKAPLRPAGCCLFAFLW